MDAVDQCAQVPAHDLVEGGLVGVAGRVIAPEVVDPQHLIVLGLEQHSFELRLELLVLDVEVLVSPGEPLRGGALDDVVELELLVVLIRLEGELEREPNEA